MSARHKTVRRSIHDVSGIAIDFGRNDAMEQMIQNETDQHFKKPWHRLERGRRLNRLRAFTESMAAQRGLKQQEQANLLTLLTKALDKKVLNSKTAVVYDAEKEEITEIKPLVMHQSATGEILFQIVEKRNAVTFRKQRSTPGQQPGPEQG
jgi:hypothetical protein